MSIRLKTGVKNTKTKAYMYFSVFILDLELFAYVFMQPPFTHNFFSLFAHHTVRQHNLIYK